MGSAFTLVTGVQLALSALSVLQFVFNATVLLHWGIGTP